MNVLFFMRSQVYLRNFESTLRLLAERGHRVHVVAEPHDHLPHASLLEDLRRQWPGITVGEPPAHVRGRWSRFGVQLRQGLDALRYRETEYADAPRLRWRAELKAPAVAGGASWTRWAATPVRRRVLKAALRACDRGVPPDPAIEAFVREHRPDVVLVTPLVEPGSPQSEFVRAARALGVRTGLCVYSWDNLTNKGLIHDTLDLVTVWNDAMKHEAIALHGVPAERVVVTGAPGYDHWFTWRPRESRADFCARVGVDPARPYLLYVCSSRFIAPDEQPFVRRWIQSIRAASPALARVSVVVRPHPQNAASWRTTDVSDLGATVVWPRHGANPVDADSRADYFDSIHHSAAVVGVNTSAQVESAIVGRGVYTWLVPEFRDTQEGTLHFRHLRDAGGGWVQAAADLADHVRQLESAVADPDAARERSRRFVQAFVRPHGLDQPATPRLVAALEATAAQGPARPDRGPWWSGPARPLLGRLAAAFDDAERLRRAKELERRASAQRRSRKKRMADAAPRAFDHYLRARERVRAMTVDGGCPGTLTDGERATLRDLAPLWQADATAIAGLRGWGKTITGVRRSHYAGERGTALRESLSRDRRRLFEQGEPALWVDEPRALGGFGIAESGHFYNADTLRFYRMTSLLDDAEVLWDLRRGPRQTVWEVGGGWGGLAYQVKTVCPATTYLITGAPETLLMSAVYLMTLFPDATCRFYDPAAPDDFSREWERVDFAFAPDAAVSSLRVPALSLLLDVDVLSRMTPDRMHLHVARAHELGCAYVLSTGPAGDAGQSSPVRDTLERYFWPHPAAAPLHIDRRLSGLGGKSYQLGWRRMVA